MSIPRSSTNVNTSSKLDSLFDADKRTSDRAERLAMTAAEMIRAAENRYQREYMLDLVHQGGNGRVEVVMPVDDPASAPWVHLLPVGWAQTPSSSWIRTYLVRGTGPNYGAADWTESALMRDHFTSSEAAEWLADYQQYIAENGVGDPDNLEDMA